MIFAKKKESDCLILPHTRTKQNSQKSPQSHSKIYKQTFTKTVKWTTIN